MSEPKITTEKIDLPEEKAELLHGTAVSATGSIVVAGVVYQDSEGFMRFDGATRHAKADEVIASLLVDNPLLLDHVMYWYESFEGDSGESSWEAMYGH